MMRLNLLTSLAVLSAAVLPLASGAHAQSVAGQPSLAAPASNLNRPGVNYDHWRPGADAASAGQLRKQVSDTTDTGAWSRARQAAAAINAGRCGDAAAIAAESRDARLMAGVKRACKVA